MEVAGLGQVSADPRQRKLRVEPAPVFRCEHPVLQILIGDQTAFMKSLRIMRASAWLARGCFILGGAEGMVRLWYSMLHVVRPGLASSHLTCRGTVSFDNGTLTVQIDHTHCTESQ